MADGGLLAFILAIDALGAALLLYLLWNIPLTLCLHARIDERSPVISGTVRLGAVGVLIAPAPGGHRVFLSVLNRRFPLSAGDRGEKEEPAEREGLPAGAFPLVPAGIRIAGAIWRRLRIREVRGRVRIGLADAAATGMLCGWYAAVCPLARLHRIAVELVPVFDRPVLEGDCAVCLDLRHPASVAWIAIRELLRPGVRRRLFAGGGG